MGRHYLEGRQMSKPDFAKLYKEALAFQKSGDFKGISELIQNAYRAGLPEDELRILGALAECAFQFMKPSGPS